VVEEFYNIFGPELKAVTGDPRHIEDVLKRVDTLVKPIEEVPLFSSLHFFTLLAQEQGLCNSWASVRPSVSLSHPTAATAAGGFAAERRRLQQISIDSCGRRSADAPALRGKCG